MNDNLNKGLRVRIISGRESGSYGVITEVNHFGEKAEYAVILDGEQRERIYYEYNII